LAVGEPPQIHRQTPSEPDLLRLGTPTAANLHPTPCSPPYELLPSLAPLPVSLRLEGCVQRSARARVQPSATRLSADPERRREPSSTVSRHGLPILPHARRTTFIHCEQSHPILHPIVNAAGFMISRHGFDHLSPSGCGSAPSPSLGASTVEQIVGNSAASSGLQ
jgi:hypothetical protein